MDDNDGSLVLRIESGHGSVLLCGDIGADGQGALLDLYGREGLESDVLLLPHHGAVVASLAEFVSAVDPEVIVNSSGAMPVHRIERLAEALGGRGVWHTFENGAVTVRLGESGVAVRGFH